MSGVAARTILTAGLLIVAACSDPAGPEFCRAPDATALPGGGCIRFEDAGRLDALRPLIEREIERTLTAVRPLIPVDGVGIRIFAGTATVIPEIGIGGRALGDYVQIVLDPDSPVLADALDPELFRLLAHELHHTARQGTVGYGADLLGALISEGLADHFTLEVAGGDPPLWSTALTAAELEVWEARAEAQWFDEEYDHAAWFLGTSPDIPRWTGYSVGFELVGRFLDAAPGRRPSALHNEPRTSFVPE